MEQQDSKGPALIVTLWGTYGTGTDEVADKLAEELNIPLHRGAYSSDDLKSAAKDPTDDINANSWYLVQAVPSHGRTTWRTIFRNVEQGMDKTRENLVRHVRDDAARGGVFVGRNATFILNKYPGALHVRLDGPLEKRVERVAKRQNLTPQQAEQDALFEDEVRASMSVQLFNWDPRTDEGYDMVLFTTDMDLDTVVAIIAGAARAKHAAAADR